MLTRLITAAAASMVALPAMAGSFDPAPEPAPVIAPAPVPAPQVPLGVDWTGPYVGLNLGYGFGDSDGDDFDGVIGGGQAGYLFDFGQFVAGAELDYNLADLGFEGDGSLDQIGRARVRAGYEIGRALPYLSGGLAYGRGEVAGDTEDAFGFTVGAGLDYLITDNLVGGVEYSYQRFDDFGGTEVDANTVAARVSFKF